MAGVGRAGQAARRLVRDQPDLDAIGRMTGEIAINVADIADAARRSGKHRESLAALKELRALLGDLAAIRGGRGERGNGGGAGGVGGPAAELESLLGSGPALGDGTDT